MILDLQLRRDSKNQILEQKSSYQPDETERQRIKEIMLDFQIGVTIQNKPYREFNDMSLLERQRRDQKSFNSYVEPESTDPDKSWRSNAVRPIVRNKVISIGAHITSALIFPQIFAQNINDEEDRNAASVMRDLIEWASEQAGYAKTFLYTVIAALVNPAVIIHTDYSRITRNIKEIQANGSWIKKEVLDESMSGFRDSIVPLDELFIGDIYEHDIQKQPFIIWRKAIDYTIAKSKYGNNEKFNSYVRPGIQQIFDETTNTFYEVFDSNLRGRLVEEVIYYNRMADLRLVVVNGVLLTDVDQPNPRKDKKYPFAKSGYELIDEGKFFYFSSLVKKMSKDEDIVNTLYRMVIDGTYLQVMPPIVVTGGEKVDASVLFPGRVTGWENTEAKAVPLNNGGNLAAGLAMIQKVESSISESSNDILQSGQAAQGSQTAFEISRLEQNAKVMLGLFGKMIGFLVKDLGELRMGDILQFLTVGEVMDITSSSGRLKFPTIILPNQMTGGKSKTKSISFNPNLSEELAGLPKDEMGRPLDFESMKKAGGLENDNEIIKVNPDLFRKMKFIVKIAPEAIPLPSNALQKAFNLEEFDRLIQLPFVDHEQVTKDLLLGSYDKTKDDPQKYILSRGVEPSPLPSIPESKSPLASILGSSPNSALAV